MNFDTVIQAAETESVKKKAPPLTEKRVSASAVDAAAPPRSPLARGGKGRRTSGSVAPASESPPLALRVTAASGSASSLRPPRSAVPAAGPPRAAGPLQPTASDITAAAKSSPLLLRPAEADTVKGQSPILSTRRAWSSERPPAFVALYSYKATDEDELTFEAGDVFVHVKRIDDGWMFAELETTGVNGEFTQKATVLERGPMIGMMGCDRAASFSFRDCLISADCLCASH